MILFKKAKCLVELVSAALTIEIKGLISKSILHNGIVAPATAASAYFVSNNVFPVALPLRNEASGCESVFTDFVSP